jgi:hypothetical protein
MLVPIEAGMRAGVDSKKLRSVEIVRSLLKSKSILNMD